MKKATIKAEIEIDIKNPKLAVNYFKSVFYLEEETEDEVIKALAIAFHETDSEFLIKDGYRKKSLPDIGLFKQTENSSWFESDPDMNKYHGQIRIRYDEESYIEDIYED